MADAVVLQKIKAQQIAGIHERSPRGKDAEHSHFLCDSVSYAVITRSIFSDQIFLQRYLLKISSFFNEYILS
ncbi:hypothetical protein [Ktedonobacter racemifer]|uniref:hypothetical protein n=1 Tax=Ktedonobacter racemifer TaxID=363277 RepID=UPI0012FA7041|nr:hypothetical protein [Ktedonobacter racemifer]